MSTISVNPKTGKMTIVNIILVVTVVMTGLIAGLLYAYSCAINPGLHLLDDAGYLKAMQSIDRAILNPVFFMSFMGTLILLPLSTILHYGQPVKFWLLLIASVIYIIGSFGVTIAGNVPLNDMLDKVDLKSASVEQLSAIRAKFEGPWNSLHAVRTWANVVSLVLVVVATMGRPIK